jgi:hypothetical protein
MEDEMLNKIKQPAHKRSIRDIPIPEGRSAKDETSTTSVDLRRKDEKVRQTKRKTTRKRKPQKRNVRAYFWGGAAVSVFILIIVLANVFSKATINIVPRSYEMQAADIDVDLVPLDNLDADYQLAYRSVDFSKTAELTVPANGEELVQEKASGIITVFNTLSSTPQKLIRNTRFESTGGLIYRTPVSVEIPGFTETGGEVVPGSIDIEVFADLIGQRYNTSSETTFVIPGFRGQEAFDFFSAKTKTNLAGGYDGVKKIIEDSDLEQAKSELNNNLKEQLKNEIDSQIPNNVIALYSDESLNFGSVEQIDAGESEATLVMSGKVSVLLIDKGDLASSVAGQQPDTGYRAGDQVIIKNLDDLTLTLIQNGSENGVKISGDIQIQWQNDATLLASELVGKSKGEFKNIISNYRGVTSVTTKFSPFWKNDFPNNPDRIIIKEVEQN